MRLSGRFIASPSPRQWLMSVHIPEELMGIRRPSCVVFLILISSTASWNAQEAMPDPPRALLYSAPLLTGARQSAMDVDASGRIYLGGYICEPTLPVTANAAQRTYAGGCDGFVAIIAPDGRLEY